MNQPPSEKPLRLLVFGAGAIGAYIGGSLALQGHPVCFLERPEVAGIVRERGLRLKIGETEHRVEAPQVAASLEEALEQNTYQAAIFALKSFDTPAAVRGLAPYASQLPPILCLSNGVENEPALAEALGEEKVIAGTVTSAIGRSGLGDIVLERLRGVGVAGDHPLSSRLASAMDAAGLNARLYPDAAGMKWSKMLTNLLANASSAILDLPPAEIFAHPGLFRLEIAQLHEALRVMDALKLAVVDLPGTPVRLLAFAVRRLPPTLSRPFLAKAVGGGRGGKMPSFHIDLHQGRGMSEVSFLNGAVSRSGQRLSIPTPANHLLTEVLTDLTEGRVSLDAYRHNPEKLLAKFALERSALQR